MSSIGQYVKQAQTVYLLIENIKKWLFNYFCFSSELPPFKKLHTVMFLNARPTKRGKQQ